MTDAKKVFDQIKSDASTWVPRWQDLSKYIDNTRGRFFSEVSDGKKVDSKTIITSVPHQSVRVMAAGLMTGLSSPSQPWFKLGVADVELMADEAVRDWLEMCEERMMVAFTMAKIYRALYELYLEIVQFGTAAALIDEDFENIIKIRSFTAGEYFLGVDDKGLVEHFGRTFYATPFQLMKEFGPDNLPDQVKQDFRANVSSKYLIYHLITPNLQRDVSKIDFMNMEYASLYWVDGCNFDRYLRAGGYNERAVVGPRWETVSCDVYGRSPSWHGLGDIKMLHKMEKDKLLVLDKVADPPVQADSSIIGAVNTLPGGVTRFSATTPNAGVRETYQMNPNLQAIQEIINVTERKIAKSFYNELFQMLENESRSQITAREIAERHEEKLLQLGPVLINLERELLSPIIERTFAIMMRNGLLPMPPANMQGMNINIEFISMLSQAQKLVSAGAIERNVAFIGNIALVKPEVLDLLDADEVVYKYGEISGGPRSMLRSKDKVVKIRQDRAKAAQAQQVAQSLLATAQIAKTASEAKLANGESMLDQTGKAMAGKAQ